MRALLSVAGIYALFVAASGFLFGQLFFGHFSLSASVAGFGGVVAALSALGVAGGDRWAAALAFWSALAALGGVALDAADYYLNLDIPGNYYAWALIGPFCLALMVIAFCSRRAAVGLRTARAQDPRP